jgi:hypothetical protein
MSQQLLVSGIAALMLISSFAVTVESQEHIDIDALLDDTQKASTDPDKMTLVWWIPEQYWTSTMGQDPSITDDGVREMVELVKPYIMVAIADGNIGAFGGVSYLNEDEIRSTVTLEDSEGNTYQCLPKAEVSMDIRNLLMMLKPIIVSMLGPLGENTHFLLFQSQSENGNTIADPKTEGSFKVVTSSEEYCFRLPLGSVLPPKFDRRTGERFPGNYKYNPFTGKKLVDKKPN